MILQIELMSKSCHMHDRIHWAITNSFLIHVTPQLINALLPVSVYYVYIICRMCNNTVWPLWIPNHSLCMALASSVWDLTKTLTATSLIVSTLYLFQYNTISIWRTVGIYSGRLRHGSTISRTAAVSAHEYHLHIINAHARDLFPYVLYCAMSERVATMLVIDLRNRRRSFVTVWSDSSECLIPLLHRFFWKKLIWSRIGEW